MRESLSIRCSGPEEQDHGAQRRQPAEGAVRAGSAGAAVVLLLSEPTRGVDVGAKEEIYTAIDMFAAAGTAIIVSSSEIGELMRLASRIYVLRNGRIVARLASSETSEEDILRRMAGWRECSCCAWAGSCWRPTRPRR